MAKSVKIDLNSEESKSLVHILMIITPDMFEDRIRTQAVISILQEFLKKLQTSVFNKKNIKKVKVHEAWALYEALGHSDIDSDDHPYESNLVNRLTNTIHQQLS